MVTECVINAAMCPVPRTFSTPQDPFSDSGKEGEGQQEEEEGGGHPGLPYATTSVQIGDIVSVGGLGPMTLVSHEVMGDNRLVSDDGCVEAEGNWQPPDFHQMLENYQEPKKHFRTWPVFMHAVIFFFPYAVPIILR